MSLPSETQKISIVISIYNEADGIGQTLVEVQRYLTAEFPGRPWEIIVVDDGSTDSTAQVVEGYLSQIPQLKLFHHRKNGGQGKGFRTAFAQATGDVVVTIDADLSYESKYIGQMIEKLEESGADIVIASAFLAGTRIENVPLTRRVLSICANKLLAFSTSLDVSAITCAVRAYRGSVLRNLPLGSRGMEINLEVVLKAEILGLHIEEIPAVLRWKTTKATNKRNKRRSYLNLARTCLRYSFFSFLFNPSLVFLLMQLFFLPLFLIYSFALAFRIFQSYEKFHFTGDTWNLALSKALQTTYVSYQYGFYIAFVSATASMFLFLVWFISKQNKFYFEQNQILISKLIR